MTATNQMVRKAIGKWGRTTHAHFGWRIEEVSDLGSEVEKCEMCERAWIRFQYLVSHPDHGPLKVGCDCGGWMVGDTERAARDIKDMRRIAAQKAREAKARAEAQAKVDAEAERASAERKTAALAECDLAWRRVLAAKAKVQREAKKGEARAASEAASARARRRGATEHEAWQAGLRAYLKAAGPLTAA
jgi:hypothetical protein